jgi:signal transduction histidine kinase
MMVALRHRLVHLASRPHLPRRTVRLRLTLLYGGVFLVSGAGLLVITYLLVEHRLQSQRVTHGPIPPGAPSGLGGIVSAPVSARSSMRAQQAADLHQLLVQSVLALAVMAVISVVLGWLVAGRALRPVRIMTASARRISAHNLHERLALSGPGDELKDLGDTIDDLLARLEAAFDSQRQFVANASHELRTPLMLDRMLLQVALEDPSLTFDSLRATCEEVLQAGKQQERLIDGLLTLARSQRGLDRKVAVDLAEVASQVLSFHQTAAASKNLQMNVHLGTAVVSGDDRLIRALISNLVENAIRHNVSDGSIDVEVVAYDGHATLTVRNTGNQVPSDQVERLLQPFQRMERDRTGGDRGVGLGLSIVAAIAAAHDATLSVSPRPGGGLTVEAAFQAVTSYLVAAR